jgi:hypothetical protein
VDWEQYLSGKGYQGRHATGAEIAYPCFFDCNEPADSKKRKLYVNGQTGMYSCKVCVSEGGPYLLMSHFGDEAESADAPAIGRRSEVLAEATDLGEKMLSNNEDVIDYLLGPRRGLSPEIIVERRLGYAPKQWPLTDQLSEGYTLKDKVSSGLLAYVEQNGQNRYYEYYRDRVLIPYIENGRVVQIRGKDIFGRYYTPVGDAVYLYNADSLKGATEAVVVEGEFDTMLLADLLATSEDVRVRKMAVVGLAGTGALPEDFDSRLSHLKRVFIGTDPDDPGRKAAEKLHDRIGPRSVVMQWPTAVLQRAAADGMELKDLDWTTWITKYHASVEEIGGLLKIKGRLSSALEALTRYRNRPTSGLRLGLPQLDATIAPGLNPGQLVIMLAKTGVGKTLILCNLAWNLREQRVLFVTLEMTAEEIWVRLVRIARFHEPYLSDESIAGRYRNLRICDENRLSEEDLERLIEEYTEDVGAKPEVIMVDYLGYYARGRKGGSTYEQTSDAAMQLKSEGKKHGAIVIAPSQVNRSATPGKPIDEDDARDSGVIEETADFMFGLWRADDALDPDQHVMPTAKLHLSILKSRHGGKGKVFLLQMGLQSLVIVDDASPDSARARRESESVFRGQSYDRWLAEQRNHDQEIK